MTRRVDRGQALGASGTLSLGALLAACGDDEPAARRATGTPEASSRFGDESSCTLTPEMTEGPFYFDAAKVRSDIRDGREGATLRLALRVRDASCEPISDAVVDIWHCDAGGAYPEEGDPFLRGLQVTDRDGIAEFTTIYPGWYQSRTVHIHAKVHLDASTVLTTQIFFDDTVSDRVFAQAPYASRGERDQRNDGRHHDGAARSSTRTAGGYGLPTPRAGARSSPSSCRRWNRSGRREPGDERPQPRVGPTRRRAVPASCRRRAGAP
jgi:protocatechuate 3,4-dioxygenase beta subunit